MHHAGGKREGHESLRYIPACARLSLAQASRSELAKRSVVYNEVTMGGKKIGEEQIRKLQRTGRAGASYMVTLPKRIVKDFGWQERQKVTIKQEGKRLIIEDWKE